MLNAKIAFYLMLGNLVQAGVPLERCLNSAMPHKLRQVASRLQQVIAQGGTLAQGMQQERVFSELEVTLIHVGEATGSLVSATQTLRQHFERRKRLRDQLINSLLQTAITYILAGPLLKVVDLASASDHPDWTCELVTRCLLWWGIPVAAFFLCKCFAPALCRTVVVSGIIDALPFFGNLQHRANAITFWRTLNVCLNAGIGYIQSLPVAARACTSGLHRSRYGRMAELINLNGLSLSDAFQTVASRRDQAMEFTTYIATGEATGRLDEAITDMTARAENDLDNALKRFTTIFPIVVYLCLALYLAYRVISFYAGYLGQVMDLI